MYRLVYSFNAEEVIMVFIEADSFVAALDFFKDNIEEGKFEDLVAFSLVNVMVADLLEEEVEGEDDESILS